MGKRWSVDRGDIAVGKFRLTSGSPRELVGWHNADCAAYEARIAELEEKVAEWEAHWEFEQGALAHEREQYAAELARVKAESLRVVRVKSENEINFGAFVRHIFLDGKFVRLERWEEQG